MWPGYIWRWVRAFAERRVAYYRTLRELRSMTDLELKDIGLTRGDIERVAKGNHL